MTSVQLPQHPCKLPASSLALETPLTAVEEALTRLRYGVVQLTVHDGRVVQMDVTERQRFT